MPTYDYQCLACKHEFSKTMTLAEYEKGNVACPKCKKKKSKQLITSFLTKTSKKS